MPDFLPPWPNNPSCPVCRQPVSISRYLAATNQTQLYHEDGSAACHVEGGTPFSRQPDGTVQFAPQILPEFVNLSDAQE